MSKSPNVPDSMLLTTVWATKDPVQQLLWPEKAATGWKRSAKNNTEIKGKTRFHLLHRQQYPSPSPRPRLGPLVRVPLTPSYRNYEPLEGRCSHFFLCISSACLYAAHTGGGQCLFVDVTDASGWEIYSRNEAPARNGDLKTKEIFAWGHFLLLVLLFQLPTFNIYYKFSNAWTFPNSLTGVLVSVPVLYSLTLTPFSLRYH